MDNVMDNGEKWESKIHQAYNYIAELESRYQQILCKTSQRFNDLSIQQEILLKSLEKDSDYSHTTQLFSPYQNSDNKRANNKISEELTKISHQIQGYTKALDKIKTTKESYTNVLECLQSFRDTYKKENNGNNLESISNILEVQEFEQQRIANDLHDVVIQSMANLVHKTDLCIRLLDIDHERAKIEMKMIVNQTREIISNIRQIVYNLKFDVIKDLGLISTLQEFFTEYSKNNHIQTNFHSNEEIEKLPESIKVSLYRIIQEACNNINKHSHADLCQVDLLYSSEKIQLTIADNGCGLEEKQNHNKSDYSGFGISIMKDRVTLLGGSFSIIPNVSRGTKIIVCIPYSNREEKM